MKSTVTTPEERRASRNVRFARRALWFLLGIELFGLLYALVVLNPADSQDWNTVAVAAAFSVFVLAFSFVGVLLASRLPSNPIGWIMFLAGFSFMAAGFSLTFAEYAVDRGHTTGWTPWAAWASSWLWIVGTGAGVPLLLLLFPDGRLPSPRWRPVMAATLGSIVFIAVSTALLPLDATDNDVPGVAHPIKLPAVEDFLKLLGAIGEILLPIAILGSVASLFVRYRKAGAEQQVQLKWLTYSALLCLGALAVEQTIFETVGESETATDIANTIASASIATLPIAIGIAILKYRLYDIDVIVNRTLVYGALTAILGVTYLGLVVLLQRVTAPVTSSESDLAVAGSTLAVAALFRPARKRLQTVIDRRFYRKRYDARRTLEGFGSHLRDNIDLDTLQHDLVAAVRETMQPSHTSLWIRS